MKMLCGPVGNRNGRDGAFLASFTLSGGVYLSNPRSRRFSPGSPISSCLQNWVVNVGTPLEISLTVTVTT